MRGIGLCLLFFLAAGRSASTAFAGEEPRPERQDWMPKWMVNPLWINRGKDSAGFEAMRKKWARPDKPKFPGTCAEVALPEDKLPKVVEGHPRLLLRTKSWKYGLSLAELRERAGKEPWKSLLNRWKKPKYGARCALYYLATEDESVVPGLIKEILDVRKVGYGMGGEPFIIYDRIYNSPKITKEQRKKIVAKLVDLGTKSGHLLEGANCGDIWRHRGGGGIDVLAAGLVLHGEHPEGKKLLRWALGYWRAAYLPAYQRSGGGWLGGGASYAGAAHQLSKGLAMWASATEEDVYQLIREKYGNFLEGQMYYWMYNIFPDGTRTESIGTDRTPWKLYGGGYELISRAYNNPDGYRFLRWLNKNRAADRGGIDPRNSVLHYDEKVDKMPPSDAFTKPSTRVWGRSGMGYVQMRSKGWAKDSTVIEFKSGDFLNNHQHHTNQNSFYIYHKGRLALHTGMYDSFGRSDHWDYYYRRSIASNTMLVFQPGEFRHGKSPVAEKDGGRVHEPGGQACGSMARNNFTQKEYMWHVQNDPRYDMGEITAFEHAADYSWSYVCGDATNAYNNPRNTTGGETRKGGGGWLANRPKIDQFTRSMIYIPANNHLVIFDRVNALEASYRKAWLLHSLGKPEVGGKLIKAKVPGHIEDFDGDVTRITWTGGFWKPPTGKDDPGRLFVRTLLPKKHYIRRIGGKGYRYWSHGKNWPPSWHGHGPDLGRKDGRGQDAGNWRIEVSPAEPAKFDNFLHLIHICDTKTEKIDKATLITAEGEKMLGLASKGWLVMFGKKRAVKGEVVYKAPKGKTEHLVVDLKRGAKYKVSGIAGGAKEMAVSKEGVLRFATEKAGTVKLVPVE